MHYILFWSFLKLYSSTRVYLFYDVVSWLIFFFLRGCINRVGIPFKETFKMRSIPLEKDAAFGKKQYHLSLELKIPDTSSFKNILKTRQGRIFQILWWNNASIKGKEMKRIFNLAFGHSAVRMSYLFDLKDLLRSQYRNQIHVFMYICMYIYIYIIYIYIIFYYIYYIYNILYNYYIYYMLYIYYIYYILYIYVLYCIYIYMYLNIY